MSNLVDDYKTEYGDFLDFKNDDNTNIQYNESFDEFIPLSSINIEQSYIYQQIESIAQSYEQNEAQKAQ